MYRRNWYKKYGRPEQQEPGLPQGYDYIFFKDGDYVVAKSGRTGEEEIRDTSFSTVANSIPAGSTVRVIGEFDLDDTVVIKEGSTFDITGAKIEIIADVDAFRLKKRASLTGNLTGTIYVSDDLIFTKRVILLHGEDLLRSKDVAEVKGLRIENTSIAVDQNDRGQIWDVLTVSNTGTAIALITEHDNQAVSMCTIEDITIVGFDKGIHISVQNEGNYNSYITSNYFSRIRILGSRYGIYIERNKNLDYTKSNSSRNVFDKVTFQSSSNTVKAVYVEGRGNYLHVNVFDIQLGQNALALHLSGDAKWTMCVGEYDLHYVLDEGQDNIILNQYLASFHGTTDIEFRKFYATADKQIVNAPVLMFISSYWDGNTAQITGIGLRHANSQTGDHYLYFIDRLWNELGELLLKLILAITEVDSQATLLLQEKRG